MWMVERETERLICHACQTSRRVTLCHGWQTGFIIQDFFSDGRLRGSRPDSLFDPSIVYRCPVCGNYQRVDESRDTNISSTRKLADLFLYFFTREPPVERLTVNDYLGIFSSNLSFSVKEERELILSMLRTFNDSFRDESEDRKQRLTDQNKQFITVVTRFLEIYDKNSPHGVSMAVEILRELGRFNEAVSCYQQYWKFDGEYDDEFDDIFCIKEVIALAKSQNSTVQRLESHIPPRETS